MPLVQQLAAPQGAQWRASRRADFELHAFGDEFAVFVRSTADTHVLSAAASALLAAMLELPGTERDVDGWFALAFQDPASADDQAERTVFATLLAELERVGVVARRSP